MPLRSDDVRLPIQLTECLCRDAAKKYRCETCGVYRDNLFDIDWQQIASMDNMVRCDHYGYEKQTADFKGESYWYCTHCGNTGDTITDLQSKGDAVSKRNRNKRKRDRAREASRPVKHDEVFETPDAWYRCVGWKKFGQTSLIRYVPLSSETSAAAEEQDLWTEEFVSQCIEAKAWVNHGKLPIRYGQKFRTPGVIKPRVCAGWEAGVLLYRDNEQTMKVSKISTWTISYIRDRFAKGGWNIVGSPQKKAAQNKSKKPFVVGGTNTKTTGATTSKCRHYHRPVEMPGGFTVHASSMNNTRKEGDGLPDWGLYADWGWRPYWRAEHISWPDFGIPFDDEIALEQIIVAVEKFQAGEDVEVGCIGGHGRTGTILGAMRVILGEDAATAIKKVRSEYCSHAIETAEQEWWIEWVESAVTGKPLAEKPTSYANFGSSSTYSVGANHAKNKAAATPKDYDKDWENGGHCSQSAHFYAWLKGSEDICPRSNSCKFWNSDVTSFVRNEKSGNWPKNMMKDAAGDPKPFTWHKARAATGGFHPNDPRSKVSSKAPVKDKPTTNVRYEVRVPDTDNPLVMTTVNVHAPRRRGGDAHAPLRKDGCVCDVCRYITSGHGAFIMPGDLTQAAIWTKEMDALETKVDDIVSQRAHMNEGRQVCILLHDGKFVESRVSDNWDAEPEEDGRFPFEIVEDNWQWIKEEKLWVWIGALNDEDFALRVNLAIMNANVLPIGIGD